MPCMAFAKSSMPLAACSPAACVPCCTAALAAASPALAMLSPAFCISAAACFSSSAAFSSGDLPHAAGSIASPITIAIVRPCRMCRFLPGSCIGAPARR